MSESTPEKETETSVTETHVEETTETEPVAPVEEETSDED